MNFNISGNQLYAEGCQALAEALKGNKMMKELNLAGCNLSSVGSNMSGVILLANAIPTMRAMKKLTISGDEAWSKPVTIETSMTKADFSDKGLGVSGAIMLTAFLPKCR